MPIQLFVKVVLDVTIVGDSSLVPAYEGKIMKYNTTPFNQPVVRSMSLSEAASSQLSNVLSF